jgi:TRAP-type uncharacterized transport system fused permease subunit
VYEKLNRFEKALFDVLALGLVLFYSYSAVVAPAATQYHRGIYVIITYVLVFLVYQSQSRLMRVVDYLLMVASVVTVGYWIFNFEAINYRTGAETQLDTVVAVVGVLIGIELARRVVGNIFVILGTLLLLYGVYGAYMPELFSHAGDTFPSLCVSIFYKSDGVFGIMANVLATYVILFVLFGAFLEASGAQKFFIDWPLAAVGHKIGGPAKVSVIASGLFGSISGSAIANTVSTGAFTIPMMKKAGFPAHVAGGIEPAASIGGMFMPPIMGAGGFIMAELTGVPYSRIMLVAIFPAVMYFFSVFCMVHYYAKGKGIVGEKSEHSAMEILRNEWIYILPLVAITIFMLTGFSAGYSAILGLATCVAVSHKMKETRMDLSIVVIMLLVLAGGWVSSGLDRYSEDAFQIQYRGDGSAATLSIDVSGANPVLTTDLEGDAANELNLSLKEYTTLDALVKAINSVDPYSARVRAKRRDELTTLELRPVAGADIKSARYFAGLQGVMSKASVAPYRHLLSQQYLVLYGLIASLGLIFWRRARGADVKTELSGFVDAARKGTESSLKIGATVGVIGIIIGVLTYSGLVLTFADIVIQLAGGSLPLTILLIALASLVLGMGVPVTAAYLITAVVAVPALTHLGVNELAAHMIVYWLSQDSNITPPVCIAAFAGATIAKANMWKTAFTSFKFAKFLYLGPFLFGYVPGFSLNGSPRDILVAFVLIIIGTWAYSWFLSGIWIDKLRRSPA